VVRLLNPLMTYEDQAQKLGSRKILILDYDHDCRTHTAWPIKFSHSR
jgi:hypothetical protein